jgi:hypothetical protein
MQIQHIGKSAVALMIDGEELRLRNLVPENIDERQAVSLLEPIGWHGARYELFTGKDCVLLFAWEIEDTPYLFEFQKLEEMLEAARLCRDYVSELLLYDDAYILVVYTTGREELTRALYEYGEPLCSTETYLTHVEEQGKSILESDAVKLLKTLLIP